nr:immunoglobulin heavy chain junction region [Mus musculus]
PTTVVARTTLTTGAKA